MSKQGDAENLPVHSIRHRRLKAAIWRNTTANGPMYNVTLTRSYRDPQTKAWHDSQSFGYDDLMNVAALLQQAHTYISGLHAKEKATPKRPARPPAMPRRSQPRSASGAMTPDTRA